MREYIFIFSLTSCHKPFIIPKTMHTSISNSLFPICCTRLWCHLAYFGFFQQTITDTEKSMTFQKNPWLPKRLHLMGKSQISSFYHLSNFQVIGRYFFPKNCWPSLIICIDLFVFFKGLEEGADIFLIKQVSDKKKIQI